MNELATMTEVFKEFIQQQMEGCSGFIQRLTTFLVVHCFGVFWTAVTFWIYLKDKLVSQARPFSW